MELPLINPLSRLIVAATQLGSLNTLVTAGLVDPYLSKRSAYQLYGRQKVQGWIKAGLISVSTPRKGLDRLTLEVLECGSQVNDCLQELQQASNSPTPTVSS
ncbi:hypothetical protein HH214_08770 [Mucilaginibacter robiniae]|uniref:Uncharacterized protein n=1 Tax=Mucilaginibacter robiniae TaxID=2728022 RepID=A0A7L5DYU5_9SPHI|nr:hypothetical protein [Mucilaginibacter robiniae]QJD95961.1 hypothetical protein HH214_08770 [Mucilaginibacter robiniae]